MAEPASLEPASPEPASRSARTEKAILDATRELLSEAGVRHLTVEKVAARSGVAKTTIYRRWRSKDDLALAVLIDFVKTHRRPCRAVTAYERSSPPCCGAQSTRWARRSWAG